MEMKRFLIFFSAHYYQVLSYHTQRSSGTNRLPFPFFLKLSSVRNLSSSRLESSDGSRPFPDYSPKKPTIRDSELTHQISTAIKQRQYEPIPRILKPFERRFRPDHLIWVLMNIKDNYKLVVDLFDWWCMRTKPSLEALCIVIQIAVAAKDLEMAHDLILDFWTKPKLDVSLSFPIFYDKLIYTYKNWGSNPLVFDIFFQVLVEIGNLEAARTFFGRITSYRATISVDSCNLLLSRLSNNSDTLTKTVEVFTEFSEFGICWNTRSFNIMIRVLCRIGKVKEAHNLLLQMEYRGCIPDVISYNSVIDGYCHSGELQMVLKIIEEMQLKKGLNPNSFTLNSLILILCKTGKVMDAERALREMTCQGIVPNNVIYTNIIYGFCKAGNITSAYRLFDEMCSLNIHLDMKGYTALICGLCQTGNIVKAAKLFHKMPSKGLVPDEVMFTALIDGYCKAGEIKEAFSLHNEMVHLGLKPNVVTYTAISDGLCKSGEVHTANELLHEMCAKGLELNITTYNVLVNGLCKMGNIDDAIKLVQDMEVAGIHPDVFTYTTVMDAYCKSGESIKAHELLREMLDRGVQPSVVTFNVLMNGFCKSRMLEDGERLLKWMLEKNILPNTTTYNSLLKQYCIGNNMRSATEMYRGMSNQGVMPNENTYNILIRGHSKARNMKEAWFLHKEMIEKGYKLTVYSYNVVIEGFIKRKKYVEAAELFREMRRDGLVADRELYKFFMELNFDEGNVAMTLELCDETIENCLVDKTNSPNI